jgi:AraC-like DNA-binding protein
VPQPIAWYREFRPCRELQSTVYAFFTFGPASVPSPHRPLLREVAFSAATFCAPQFADGHVSMLFELGRTCDEEGGWYTDAGALHGSVGGPMSGVGRVEGNDRPEMVGVYFRAAPGIFRFPVSELTDRAVPIDDLWGARGAVLLADLCDLDEGRRINWLESVLLSDLARSRRPTRSLDVQGLAECILRLKGRVTVERLARAAGVSRQHLTREFRERIGLAPKLYCRLARFRAGLAYVGSPARIDWARAAADMGYADQSHMIAEFRRFSGLTPEALVRRYWFHPFIERARSPRRGDDRSTAAEK